MGGWFVLWLVTIKTVCGENEWHQYLQNKVIEKTVLLLYVCVCVCVCVGGGGGLLVCKNDNPISLVLLITDVLSICTYQITAKPRVQT